MSTVSEKCDQIFLMSIERPSEDRYTIFHSMFLQWKTNCYIIHFIFYFDLPDKQLQHLSHTNPKHQVSVIMAIDSVIYCTSWITENSTLVRLFLAAFRHAAQLFSTNLSFDQSHQIFSHQLFFRADLIGQVVRLAVSFWPWCLLCSIYLTKQQLYQ